MGLSATVYCDCWRTGVATAPPFPIDERYGPPLPSDDRDDFEALWAWSATACAHPGLELARWDTNWPGVRYVQEIARGVDATRYGPLVDLFPSSNDGWVDADVTASLAPLARELAAQAHGRVHHEVQRITHETASGFGWSPILWLDRGVVLAAEDGPVNGLYVVGPEGLGWAPLDERDPVFEPGAWARRDDAMEARLADRVRWFALPVAVAPLPPSARRDDARFRLGGEADGIDVPALPFTTQEIPHALTVAHHVIEGEIWALLDAFATVLEASARSGRRVVWG